MYNKISVNKQMCIINDTAVIRENMQYKDYVLNYTKLYIVYIILNMAVFCYLLIIISANTIYFSIST